MNSSYSVTFRWNVDPLMSEEDQFNRGATVQMPPGITKCDFHVTSEMLERRPYSFHFDENSGYCWIGLSEL